MSSWKVLSLIRIKYFEMAHFNSIMCSAVLKEESYNIHIGKESTDEASCTGRERQGCMGSCT